MDICSHRDSFKSYLLISGVRKLTVTVQGNPLKDLRFTAALNFEQRARQCGTNTARAAYFKGGSAL